MTTLRDTLERAERVALSTWNRGFIAALAALAQYEQDTIYDDVVQSGGSEELVAQARKDGAMRWSGLSGYVRRERKGD